MLHFEGERDFPQAPADLWSKLSDARFLAMCIPGAESVASVAPDKVTCTLRPGFAFVRGTLELTLQVVEATEATSARYLNHTKGIGSSTDVEANLVFAPQDKGTRIHWTADIKSLDGLIKAVPPGLIKASAQKVIADVWALVESKLKG